MSPVSSTIRSQQPVEVYAGATFATLAKTTTVFARTVQRSLSPGVDTAELVSDYGRIARPNAPWATVAPTTLKGQCVEVRVDPYATGAFVTVFQGIVTADVVQPDGAFAWLGGTQVHCGQVRHVCRGLDWILERISPHLSVTVSHGNVGELFAFNGRGSPPESNCSAAKTTDSSGTSRVFAWGTSAGLWNARDVVEYVLRFATANSDFTWVLGGAYAALEAVTPQVEQRGRTLRQILTDCIRAQDGFAWKLSVAGTTVTLTVVSLSDTAVTDLDGNEAIPANADTFALSASVDTDRDVQAPIVTPVAESAYRRVEVVSEPIRVIAMLGRETSPGASDGFVPAWTPAEEVAFTAASDDDRDDDLYRRVFADYKLPDDWTGQDWAGNYVIPAWDASAAALTWPAPPSGFVPPAIVFERALPHDDTGSREADEDAALLLLWNGSTWVQPERIAGRKPKASVGVQLRDTGPIVRLRVAHNATLAPAGWAGTSATRADWSPYDDGFLLSASFYSQTQLSVRYDAGTGSGTKRIYAPGFHLWVCPYGATWSPGRAIAAGTVLRDDTAALKRLAAQLSYWYTRTRNTLQYSALVAPAQVNVGRVCTAVTTAGGVTIIGTPVTSEVWTWDDRGGFGYRLSTDFADLDLTSISRRRVEQGERETSRRVRRIEERIAGLPLREPSGGAAGGSGLVGLLKITGLHTDSPASGVRIYRGDLYGNGTAAAATETNVTVRIPGIAADVVLPSSGAWADVPACLGVGITATWSGATQTHANDTVYEAVGLLLVL